MTGDRTGRRAIPIVATILVLAAAATMVALGVWQLQRAEWKGAMIARYQQAQSLSSGVPWPRDANAVEQALFRHSSFTCARVLSLRQTAGRSLEGRAGWSHVALCALAGGGEAEVALGWSERPRGPEWDGGEVIGFIAPAGEGARLVASPPLAGLAPLSHPDPNDLPNNHLAYAGQWFLFALTALVIYFLAVRRRTRAIR